MNSPLDPRDIHGRDWEVFEVTPEYRRSRLWLDDKSYIVRTEYLGEEELIALNQQELAESEGKRFGDGKVVARVPLNMLFGNETEIAAKLREGDRDHLRWWLNSEKARPFRTFRGRV